MAEEIEDLPGEEESGGSPWGPVFAIIILMPIITLLMFKFLIIPMAQSSHGGSDHGDAGGHGADAAHGGDDGHGGGDGGGDGHAATYEFKDIVANLSGSMKSRFIKISFTVEGTSPDFAAIVAANEVKLIDATLGILSSVTITDLEEPGVKNVLRNDLLNAFETTLKSKVIEQLYFSDLIVQ